MARNFSTSLWRIKIFICHYFCFFVIFSKFPQSESIIYYQWFLNSLWKLGWITFKIFWHSFCFRMLTDIRVKRVSFINYLLNKHHFLVTPITFQQITTENNWIYKYCPKKILTSSSVANGVSLKFYLVFSQLLSYMKKI